MSCSKTFILSMLVFLIQAAVGVPRSEAAGIGEPGSDIWVDGPDAVQPGSNRGDPDASVGPTGNPVFVWSAFGATGGARNDIFMRRFDSAGTALGEPMMVNTSTEDDQVIPRVAVSGDDSYLVIWQSEEPDPDVGVDRIFIRSQAFNADGDPVGNEQLINTELTGQTASTHFADVAALTGGGYIVVWHSRKSPGQPDANSTQYIEARLVSADGTPDGPEFKANGSEGVGVGQPTVTGLSDGSFLVVWSGTSVEIQARRLMANGTPADGDFKVNTLTDGREAEPHVAQHSDGRIMVVWKTQEIAGEDREIRGRLFSSALNPLGDDFRINTLTDSVQENPKVGGYGRSGFFVAWESAVSAGDDNDGRSIQGRIVAGSDQFGSADFQINRFIAVNQNMPGLDSHDGRVAIAWRSNGNEETMDDVITAQIWNICGIFCNGFE